MVVFPTPGISELRSTCDKITGGNAAAKPFSRVSVEGEVFFQVVVKYTCEEGSTVIGSVGGSSYFEMRCERRCDLDNVVSGAEICELVSCGNISSTDAPNARSPSSTRRLSSSLVTQGSSRTDPFIYRIHTMGPVEAMEASPDWTPGAPLCSVLCPRYQMQPLRKGQSSVNIVT